MNALGRENVAISNFNMTEIAQMLSDYVCRMEDKERHTEAACKEVDNFDICCMSEFPNNVRLQKLMLDKMMDCAVEFEESGFIAGFQTAVALLLGKEEILPQPTQITSHEEEKRLHVAISKPQKASEACIGCITSLQIAELFGHRNQKVISRIEERILPYLDKDSRAYFEKVDGVNIQNKPVTFYKMNRVACQMYLDLMESKKSTFVNIAGGYAKLQELMERVFPTDRIAVTA